MFAENYVISLALLVFSNWTDDQHLGENVLFGKIRRPFTVHPKLDPSLTGMYYILFHPAAAAS